MGDTMATNFAHATYTEVIDLQTVADKVSVIGIHTPRGKSPYNRLKGFFTQFTKFRYDGIRSLIMCPAANLPVDPLGLTGVPQTTDLMDPRDALNPILFHGAHGDHLSNVLDQIYTKTSTVSSAGALTKIADLGTGIQVAPSADKFDNDFTNSQLFDVNNYYSKLTDRTWKKFGIQSAVKLGGLRPLVNRVVRNTPLLPSYGTGNGNVYGMISVSNSNTPNKMLGIGSAPLPSDSVGAAFGEAAGEAPVPDDGSTGLVNKGFDNQMFTSGKAPLGWLPTTMNVAGQTGITLLPKIFMGVLVLPPAYNVEQFFRMVITHSFSFKGFTSSLGSMDESFIDNEPNAVDGVPYTNWIDYGDTLDSVGAKSEVLSDGVM